jgi:hypothetical protein
MAPDTGRPTIAIFGLGVLGGDVLDFLGQSGRDYDLVVCTRDDDKARLRINLSRYTA